MLEIRPGCEHCNKALPPDSTEAMICSFECTFCQDCVEHVLHNVCPNCAGGFVPRPVRPQQNRIKGNYLGNYPATTRIVNKPVDLAAHQILVSKVKSIPPHQR
jgi:hypothetical protein